MIGADVGVGVAGAGVAQTQSVSLVQDGFLHFPETQSRPLAQSLSTLHVLLQDAGVGVGVAGGAVGVGVGTSGSVMLSVIEQFELSPSAGSKVAVLVKLPEASLATLTRISKLPTPSGSIVSRLQVTTPALSVHFVSESTYSS